MRSNLGYSLSTTPRVTAPSSHSPNHNVLKDIDTNKESMESYKEFTDFWDLENAKLNKYIELN